MLDKVLLFLNVGDMQFIYETNRLLTTKVDSAYFSLLANNVQSICPGPLSLPRHARTHDQYLPYHATCSALSVFPYTSDCWNKDCVQNNFVLGFAHRK